MRGLLEYWNLRERPFEATWDTRFFYQSRDHEEALSRLGFLATEQTMNLGMLTGEIGSGKTLTRAVFAQSLDPRHFEVIVQECSAFRFNDLLAGVLQRLDPEGKGRTKYERWERLRQAAEKIHAENRHLVLIFDEAQEMSPGTLSDLKMLTNLNGGGRNLLSIILLGQPELREQVARFPAINQRISLRFHLRSLDFEDSGRYVRHRLRMAGHPSGNLFPDEALGHAFAAARGIPRELNRLAKLSLEYAWLRELPLVTEHAVDTVVRDLTRHQNLQAA